MKNLKKGQTVINQYGEVLTVKHIMGNSVYVLEEYNCTYHITKVWAI